MACSGIPGSGPDVFRRMIQEKAKALYLDFFFEIDPFGDHLDEILSYHGPGK
jgi:hypothetical protein